jgi:hypothetical protein
LRRIFWASGAGILAQAFSWKMFYIVKALLCLPCVIVVSLFPLSFLKKPTQETRKIAA